jgi:hypothetical protein
MIPKGYRLVPETVTDAMGITQEQWTAAIKAAPRPPVPEVSPLVQRLNMNYVDWQNGRKPKRESGPDWFTAAETLEAQEDLIADLREQVRALMDAQR